jgi:hypothetical protein
MIEEPDIDAPDQAAKGASFAFREPAIAETPIRQLI